MKRIALSIILAMFAYSSISAQLYGDTDYNDDNTLSDDYITWWRIITGSDHSGVFTQYGVYVDENNIATSVKVALYDHDPNDGDPNNLLDNLEFTPVNGAYNEMDLSSEVPLEPDTYYYIAFRGNENFRIGRNNDDDWPYSIPYLSILHENDWPEQAPANVSSIQNLESYAIYLIANNIALPISLDHFDVQKERYHTILNWTTSTETNNKGWNIQRSNNGYTWNTIGWSDGEGNSSISQSYKFSDKNPANGMNYYRLEQVDFDGQMSYSDVKSVMFTRTERNISIYPNPAQDFVQIQNSVAGTLKIYTQQGELVQDVDIPNDGNIDISDLSIGTYIFSISEAGYEESFSIQIQR